MHIVHIVHIIVCNYITLDSTNIITQSIGETESERVCVCEWEREREMLTSKIASDITQV